MVLLLAAVLVVLLIGCADVANLMFSRMAGRQREFALRAALGAGNWRLVRQTLTEGLILSVAGGALGLCLAFVTLPILLRIAPQDLPILNQIGFDWRVAAFVFAITFATPLFFCLAPIWNLLRSAVADQLRGGGRSMSQGKQQSRIMSATVVLQFSLAFVLLAVAGLLLRSFVKASESNPGFRSEHLISVRIDLPPAIYRNTAQITGFFDRLLDKLNALPGVQQTGAVSNLPMYSSSNRLVSAEGRSGMVRTDTVFCLGNALGALHIRLLHGRLLTPGDLLGKPRPAVLSETLVRRIWPRADPIGRRIKFGESSSEPWLTVVGVVKDVKEQLASNSPRALLFTTPEDWVSDMNVLLRTTQDPLSLAPTIRRQVHRIDPSLPAGKLETLDQVLGESLSPERFRSWLLGAFAASALLLAMLGIAGLLAYQAAQRNREFGIRLALGANRRDLLLLIFKHAISLSVAGIAIGLVVTIFVTRAVSALLFETSRYDPTTFVAVPLLLALVALAATALPAWRASRADPLSALKAE